MVQDLFDEIGKILDDNCKDIVFWGCGGVTANLWMDAIIESGYKAKYYVDKYKDCSDLYGNAYVKPDSLLATDVEKNALLYIIFTVDPLRLKDIKKELTSYGILGSNIVSCAGAYFYRNQKEIYSLYEKLFDDISKQHLESYLKCKIFGDTLNENQMVRNSQYFSVFEFQRLDSEEVYVDAGAFVGDTLEKYLFEKFGTFKHYYAFEPYKQNYKAIKYRTNRLIPEWGLDVSSITIENFALDSKIGTANINDSLNAAGALIEENGGVFRQSINTCTLDQYFENIKYTTLKADIEGKELDMLRGGKNTIRRYETKLAISVYHLPQDLIEIPKYIISINDQYHLKFRCHMPDGSDSILYAYL